jgi:hypothetical protein
MTALLVNGRPIPYDTVPVSYMADGLRLYFEHRIPPGSFMLAVLSNDLSDACGRADWLNRQNICRWVDWLRNYAPREAWGSPERVQAWLRDGVVPLTDTAASARESGTRE